MVIENLLLVLGGVFLEFVDVIEVDVLMCVVEVGSDFDGI